MPKTTDEEAGAEGKAQVVDTYTGEVFDFEWKNPVELRTAFERAKALEAATKRAREKIQGAVQAFVGDETEYDFGDGSKFIWITGSLKRYRPETVRRYLDEDQFALVVDINGTRLKKLLADLVKEGVAPRGAWKDIEEQAELQARKPYIKLETVKL